MQNIMTRETPPLDVILSTWVTAKEAATQLGVTVQEVRRVCRETEHLWAIQMGTGETSEWRIEPNSVNEYAEKRKRA